MQFGVTFASKFVEKLFCAMKKLFVTLSLFLLILFRVEAQNAGYHLDVHIDGLHDTLLIMGYHFGEKKFIADSAFADANGHAVFEGDTLLNGGIYFIILPEKNYFEFMLTDDQTFEIRVKRDSLISTLQFKGSTENDLFADYQRFMMDMQMQRSELMQNLKLAGDDSLSKAKLNADLQELDKRVDAYWARITTEHPTTLLASVIKAMMPIEIPKFTAPQGASNPDSLRWAMSYNYNQLHYFDNINLNDRRLIRSPILVPRINNYFDHVLLPLPDTLIAAACMLIEKSKADSMMFQFVVQHLLNKFLTSDHMGMDGVFAKIAERYYLDGEAWWADAKLIDNIRENVECIIPNMIGKQAPELKLLNEKMQYVDLYDIKAKITVIYFWDIDCSHCKKVTPELKKLYTEYKPLGLEVFGVYTQGDQPKWMEYTREHGLNWVNVWRPNIGSDFRKNYNVKGTPVIYVLDANKKILAKRISHETLAEILEIELKKKSEAKNN